jgi:hypothetical protein
MNMPPSYEGEEQKGDCRLVLLVRRAELLQEDPETVGSNRFRSGSLLENAVQLGIAFAL